jgi:hypothetical protein
MEQLINDYENGQLKEAKDRAKRFKNWEIRDGLRERLAYSLNRATLTADWLKGRDCWQAACDAE